VSFNSRWGGKGRKTHDSARNTNNSDSSTTAVALNNVEEAVEEALTRVLSEEVELVNDKDERLAFLTVTGCSRRGGGGGGGRGRRLEETEEGSHRSGVARLQAETGQFAREGREKSMTTHVVSLVDVKFRSSETLLL
jgi:hypothetical protein